LAPVVTQIFATQTVITFKTSPKLYQKSKSGFDGFHPNSFRHFTIHFVKCNSRDLLLYNCWRAVLCGDVANFVREWKARIVGTTINSIYEVLRRCLPLLQSSDFARGDFADL
jgi:hypothetical protein